MTGPQPGDGPSPTALRQPRMVGLLPPMVPAVQRLAGLARRRSRVAHFRRPRPDFGNSGGEMPPPFAGDLPETAGIGSGTQLCCVIVHGPLQSNGSGRHGTVGVHRLGRRCSGSNGNLILEQGFMRIPARFGWLTRLVRPIDLSGPKMASKSRGSTFFSTHFARYRARGTQGKGSMDLRSIRHAHPLSASLATAASRLLVRLLPGPAGMVYLPAFAGEIACSGRVEPALRRGPHASAEGLESPGRRFGTLDPPRSLHSDGPALHRPAARALHFRWARLGMTARPRRLLRGDGTRRRRDERT